MSDEHEQDAIRKLQQLLGVSAITARQSRVMQGLTYYASWVDELAEPPAKEKVEDMTGSRQVCPECRVVAPIVITCAHANKIWVGSKWRAPKKGNDRAWKRIQQGDIQWDHAAIEAKAKKEAEARILLEMRPNSRSNRAKRKKMMEDWHANRGKFGRI